MAFISILLSSKRGSKLQHTKDDTDSLACSRLSVREDDGKSRGAQGKKGGVSFVFHLGLSPLTGESLEQDPDSSGNKTEM